MCKSAFIGMKYIFNLLNNVKINRVAKLTCAIYEEQANPLLFTELDTYVYNSILDSI